MIQIFIENGIGAKAFKYLTSEDIDDKELGISFGGRKVLKQLLKTVSKSSKVWNFDQKFNLLCVRKIYWIVAVYNYVY